MSAKVLEEGGEIHTRKTDDTQHIKKYSGRLIGLWLQARCGAKLITGHPQPGYDELVVSLVRSSRETVSLYIP